MRKELKNMSRRRKDKDYFEEISKTEDGYIGYLAKGYITDNETFSIFADSIKDLYDQAEIEGVHKIPDEEWLKY